MCRLDMPAQDPVIAAQKKDQKLPSGFERRKNLVLGIFATLLLMFSTVYFLNPNIAINSKYCEEEGVKECRRPDMVAYKFNSLMGNIVMGLLGIYHWHFTPQLRQLAKATPEDRMFGYLPAADYHNAIIIAYQTWDFVISCAIPEQFDPIFLAHHILAILCAYYSLDYQMVPYYSVFFGGCSEFSSIFLVFIDSDKFPITPGSLMDRWTLICKAMFFLTFSYYRVVGWIQYSIILWADCRAVVQSGSIEQQRPGKTFFIRIFQALDFVLGALQLYWYYDIVMKVASILS